MGENEHSKAASRTAEAGREIQREADAKTRQGSGHNGGSEKKPVQAGPGTFARSLAGSLIRAGIRINVIAPGRLDASTPPTDRAKTSPSLEVLRR